MSRPVGAGSAAGMPGPRRTIRGHPRSPRGAAARLAAHVAVRPTLAAWALTGVAWAQPLSWPDLPLEDLRPGIVCEPPGWRGSSGRAT